MYALTITTATGRCQVKFAVEQWAIDAANALNESTDVEDMTILDADGAEVRYWEMTDAA